MATTQENTDVQSINDQDGNVSVTEADKTKKSVPNVNFNVNVKANYDKLVDLAAHMIDDESGEPMTVHQYCKATLFSQLGLNMQGEVLRKAKTVAKVEDSLLAKIMGADKVKAMTAGDRAKKEKQVVKGLSDQLESNPELMAAVLAAMAKLATSADKQDSIEQAAILAK